MSEHNVVTKRRRRGRRKNTTSKQSRILQSNPFGALAHLDDDDENTSASESDDIRAHTHNTHSNNQNNTIKTPPIITTGNYNVNEIMRVLNITKYTYKQMSIGTKILIENKEEHDKCQKYLTEKKIEFYSHRPRGNKILKAVVYGLPQTDTNQLKLYFNRTLHIDPIEIYEMNTKNKDKNNSLYLFHFNKDQITMNGIRKIKVISHTIVKWMPYSPKFKGPTQCRNCTVTAQKIVIETKYVYFVLPQTTTQKIATWHKMHLKMVEQSLDASTALTKTYLTHTEQMIQNAHSAKNISTLENPLTIEIIIEHVNPKAGEIFSITKLTIFHHSTQTESITIIKHLRHLTHTHNSS